MYQPPEPRTVRITVHLSAATLAELDRMRAELGVTRSVLVRELLDRAAACV